MLSFVFNRLGLKAIGPGTDQKQTRDQAGLPRPEQPTGLPEAITQNPHRLSPEQAVIERLAGVKPDDVLLLLLPLLLEARKERLAKLDQELAGVEGRLSSLYQRRNDIIAPAGPDGYQQAIPPATPLATLAPAATPGLASNLNEVYPTQPDPTVKPKEVAV